MNEIMLASRSMRARSKSKSNVATLGDPEEANSDSEKQNEEISREQRKLSRICRVYRDIRKITALDEEIKTLGEVTPLPENELSSLDAAEREHLGAATRVETPNEQVEAEQKQHDRLICNEELLIREDDIQAFHKRRIDVQKENTDLPHRVAELASAEENLWRLAGELEWKWAKSCSIRP
jgi:hypothetical protein